VKYSTSIIKFIFGSAVAVTAVLVGCHSPLVPVAPMSSSSSADISDAVHGTKGNSHFYFLPPMVSNPKYSGDFDANVSVSVQIDTQRLDKYSQTYVWDVVKTYNATLDLASSQYKLNWNTSESEFVVGKIGRAHV
jgi:hypothetical protein